MVNENPDLKKMRCANGKREDEQKHQDGPDQRKMHYANTKQGDEKQDLLGNLLFQWNSDQRVTVRCLSFQRSKRDDADVLVERHGNRDGVVADGLSC
jgi:hypothetical protein